MVPALTVFANLIGIFGGGIIVRHRAARHGLARSSATRHSSAVVVGEGHRSRASSSPSSSASSSSDHLLLLRACPSPAAPRAWGKATTAARWSTPPSASSPRTPCAPGCSTTCSGLEPVPYARARKRGSRTDRRVEAFGAHDRACYHDGRGRAPQRAGVAAGRAARSRVPGETMIQVSGVRAWRCPVRGHHPAGASTWRCAGERPWSSWDPSGCGKSTFLKVMRRACSLPTRGQRHGAGA